MIRREIRDTRNEIRAGRWSARHEVRGYEVSGRFRTILEGFRSSAVFRMARDRHCSLDELILYGRI